ncbi:MAG: hypothetical protein U5J63_00415 [Fodinibius sp.]|nr:hypothetical protein [Fodinibius sp.]
MITITTNGPNGNDSDQIELNGAVITPGTVTLESETKNIVATDYGTQVPFTVYIGDKNNNVMIEGAEVSFTTTGGYIETAATTRPEWKSDG